MTVGRAVERAVERAVLIVELRLVLAESDRSVSASSSLQSLNVVQFK